jgi:plastocyanin
MSVQFVNSDSITHNPTANDGSWTSGNIAPSGQNVVNFPNAGNFAYHCAIHPNMVATVTVN